MEHKSQMPPVCLLENKAAILELTKVHCLTPHTLTATLADLITTVGMVKLAWGLQFEPKHLTAFLQII